MDSNPAFAKWDCSSVSPLPLSSPIPSPLYSPLSRIQPKTFEAEASVSQSYPRTSTTESERVESSREGGSRAEAREAISHEASSPRFPAASPLPRLFPSSLSLTSSRDPSKSDLSESPIAYNPAARPISPEEDRSKATVLKRKRLHIEPNGQVLPDRRTWTDMKNGQGEGRESYKQVRCAEPGIFFEPRKGLYQVSTFIPKTSFVDTDLVGLSNLTQKLIIDLPSVKMIELTLKAQESFADFCISDGYGTGCILRSQRNKVLLRIHTHEYHVSQGDSFFLPTGNQLSITNTAERLSVLLQLVLIKCP